MSRSLRLLSVLVAVVLSLAGIQALTLSGSAAPPGGYWTATDERPGGDRGSIERRVEPRRYAAFTLDRAGLRDALDAAPGEDPARRDDAGAVVTVPAPNGELIEFRVHEVAVMEAGLAARHPELKTYAGRAVGDPTATIRLDLTPMGFHASVRGSGDRAAWYVDPAWNGDDSIYLSYRNGDLPRSDRGLVEPDLDADAVKDLVANAGEAPGAEVSLRTYRLALVTDPSYATYFGTQNVLAEKVTLMNRVNQIYNDDLAIRMVLVNDTDKLNLDTSAKATEANGPCGSAACFTPAQITSCAGATLNRNRIVLGQLIGASNYDIGHIALGVNGGGVAGLGVVGGDGKARGCTGIPSPEGDYFAVDYVAHEMGHQFGGPHTFNGTEVNCSGGNRSAGSAYEPGSGSSIMAYAGICQQDNLQPHSDPYFSQRSITDISTTVTASRAAINDVQTVSLRGFDTDGESFTLTVNGTQTSPIVRGTSYTLAGIDLAIEAVTGVGTVDVRGFGGTTTLDDTGFEVRFTGAPYTGTDVAAMGFAPASGDVTGFVGETAQGGAQRNGGSTVTPSGNHAPVATAPVTKTIPIRTPFALTGQATDPDGDPLVYIWEQNDKAGAVATTLGSQTKLDGPLFRIFGTYAPVTPAGALQINSPGENLASSDPTRVFPDMAQILANNTNALDGTCPPMPPKPPVAGSATNVPVPIIECFAEWLPTADYVGSAAQASVGWAGNTEPSLDFRFTARDLAPEGGGYSYGDVKLLVDKTVGPFRVTSKGATTAAAIGGRTETIYWTATTAALSPNVKISLSLDGGQTFPTVLAESTPNDGNAQVTWPDVSTTKARIKVEAVENYFFDVNDADITITGTEPPTTSPTTIPSPTPTTTPVPTPTDQVAPRIGTKMVKPVEVGTRVKLRITVRADDVVPSGKVKIRIHGAGKARSWTETLTRRGRASVLLPSYKRTGKVRVVVRYLGDDAVEAGRKKIRFTVVDRAGVR